MHSFNLANPVMAEGFEDYLDPVVSLCQAVGAFSGTAHMTVDEKVVAAGMSQRRPKPHIDGCFMPNVMRWGGGPGWFHYHNEIGNGVVSRMAVIVAASVPGCRVWRGEFEGMPREDGDLSHLTLDEGVILPANVGYLLYPDCIHESIMFNAPTVRTFLRIALPIGYECEI